MKRYLWTALALAHASTALAQTALLDRMAGQGAGTLDAERLRPGQGSDAILDVESGTLGSDPNVSLWLGYSRLPIRARWNVDGKVSDFGVVDTRIGGNLAGSFALTDWMQLGFDVPVVFYQTGTAVLPGISGVNPVASAGLGDLRLSPKFGLARADQGDALDVAVVLHATLPTSLPRHEYIGDGLPTLAAELAFSRDYGALRWAANVGPRLRVPSVFAGAAQGQELGYRFALSYDVDAAALGHAFAIDATANGAALLAPSALSAGNNPAEALLGIRTEFAGLQYFAAAGAGLPDSGVGAPLFRALAGIRYVAGCQDGDGDGLCGSADACPDAAEDADGFQDSDGCPDDDNDGDGVFDTADKCATEAEDVDGFQDADGCPDPDNDGDGVLDANDRCPGQAGVASEAGCPVVDGDKDGVADAADRCPAEPGTAAMKGCPDTDNDGLSDLDDKCPSSAGGASLQGCPDTDGDGIADPDDKCPTQAEVVNNIDDTDGCPDTAPVKMPVLTKVTMSAKSIELSGKVQFESAMSHIRPESFPLLDEVALLLKAQTGIRLVRIEGHTDSSGRDEVNLELSQGRADSVKAYLVAKGVEANRLLAQGLGESQPIADNATPEGREQNRRVIFVIVEQTK